MNIGFIGAGKVGFSLGKYFSINHLNISGFYSRNLDSAIEASKFTDSNFYYNINDLVHSSDIIFVTTPDDTIETIWNDLKKTDIKNKIICHTSGSLSSEIFSDINLYGSYGYSIHPIFPFSDKFNSYKTLRNAYFSIEGNIKYLNLLKEMLESIGNDTFIINKEDKSLYHLSSVCVSNLVLSLISIGCNYLANCGISKEDALQALLPLIQSNIENLKEKGILNSLTGPLERNDVGTIKKHLDSILDTKEKDLYKSLSYNLLSIARKKHPGRNYYNMEEILRGGN